MRCMLLIAALVISPTAAAAAEPHQATGVKVGEVTQDSAIVWVRRTANSTRNSEGLKRIGRAGEPLPEGVEPDELEGAVPGAAGQVRVRYSKSEDLAEATATDWTSVSAETDFSHQFRLTGLQPGTRYYFSAETSAGEQADQPLTGSFHTAPAANEAATVRFTVVTGMAYKDIDHADGFHIFQSMLEPRPDFVVFTGDTVYMDSEDPRATSMALARYHWQRMYGMPRHIELHRRAPGYWEKDDHDTFANDFWPGQRRREMAPLTYEQGLLNINQQVPMGDSWYRTVRWGSELQVWFVEGRDFRSPNNMPDGPEKTIWGAEQIRWLQESLLASDARWRVLVSPTPIVGPDRGGKADNHANKAFSHEGNAIRKWFVENLGDNFFVCCGDRHWQYHSVDPATGLQEFSCGPASDKHAGGSPGLDEEYHRFHRVNGGYLSLAVEPQAGDSSLTFTLHDVYGKPVYQHKAK